MSQIKIQKFHIQSTNHSREIVIFVCENYSHVLKKNQAMQATNKVMSNKTRSNRSKYQKISFKLRKTSEMLSAAADIIENNIQILVVGRILWVIMSVL